MALYLPDQNALFLRIPQTNSQLVVKALTDSLRLKVETVGYRYSHKDLVGTLRWEKQPYTFTFVRHPLDWYASFWRGRTRSEGAHWASFQNPETQWQPLWPIEPELGSDDFAEFIDRVCERGGLLQEMYRLYTGRGTADEIDFVGKTESMGTDLSSILEIIGVDHDRTELSLLDDRRTRHRSLYDTPKLTELVACAERETFAAYRYEPPALARKHDVRYPLTVDDIPGWFHHVDRELFRALLAWQVLHEPVGDLVELGCFLGKSAVVMSEALQPNEEFTVCDLFATDPADYANSTENRVSFPSLDRDQFERNYLRFRATLPTILQMPTSSILDHVKPGSTRFVHVDASHIYEHVEQDVAATQTMLRPSGIVAFDDFRSEHTPGVAYAVWRAMAQTGLAPIVLTAKKWYGTWGDPRPARQAVREWAAGQTRWTLDVQVIDGQEVLRVAPVKTVREEN